MPSFKWDGVLISMAMFRYAHFKLIIAFGLIKFQADQGIYISYLPHGENQVVESVDSE